MARALTVRVESEAHVHKGLGRREVLRLVALEETHGKVLHQAKEDLLRHSLVIHSLQGLKTVFHGI